MRQGAAAIQNEDVREIRLSPVWRNNVELGSLQYVLFNQSAAAELLQVHLPPLTFPNDPETLNYLLSLETHSA